MEVSSICKNSKYCPIVDILPEQPGVRKKTIFRVSGDGYLMVEYGDKQVFDLMDAFRLFTIMERLENKKIDGVIEYGQAFRTLTIIYDPVKTSYKQLIKELKMVEEEVGSPSELTFKSRLLHIPLTFEDNVTRKAIEYYANYIRKDAPNIIDGHNIKYVALYNGVTVDELKQKILNTEWLIVHQLSIQVVITNFLLIRGVRWKLQNIIHQGHIHLKALWGLEASVFISIQQNRPEDISCSVERHPLTNSHKPTPTIVIHPTYSSTQIE
jgi:hypothetical protein